MSNPLYGFDSFIAGNDYLSEDAMKMNAAFIWRYFYRKGWTMQAVAGMLGNMETESTINPGIWENLDEGNLSGGFGIVQWTPATKYRDWCDEYGDPIYNENGEPVYHQYTHLGNQCKRIAYEMANDLQWIPTDTYPMTFREFSKSTDSAYNLAAVFIANYERPKIAVQPIRGTQAEKWFAFIRDEVPLPSNRIPGVIRRKKRMGLLLMTADRRRI